MTRMSVRLAAMIVALGGMAAASPTPFDDVTGQEYFGPAVGWMHEQGLTTGIGGTAGQPSRTFGPDQTIDRAQLATLLWRMAGTPVPTLRDDGFTDTSDVAYYSQAVRWLRERGHTTGVGGSASRPSTTFDPHGPVDRAQAITLLWRYAGSPVSEEPHRFADIDPGPPPTYYEQAVRWARWWRITTGEGGTTGVPSSLYRPHAPVTRGQVATFIWRYAGRPAPDEPGGTHEGAYARQPYMRAAWIVEHGTESTSAVVIVRFSEGVDCDDSAEAASQFRLFREDPLAVWPGVSIDCGIDAGPELVRVTFSHGEVRGADELHYSQHRDPSHHLRSTRTRQLAGSDFVLISGAAPASD